MSTLRIVRSKGGYGKFRALAVRLDGQIVGRLREGEDLEIPRSGTELSFSMDWARSGVTRIDMLPPGAVVTARCRFTINPLRQLGLMALPVVVSVVEGEALC